MAGESLSNPELPSQRFLHFVDSHTDVILEHDPSEPDLTREATWKLSDASRLVPIDSVHFKVLVVLGEDQTMFHEIQFTFDGQPVFWIGHDSTPSLFTSVIGENQTETEISEMEVVRLLEELATLEQNGKLRRQ